MTTRSNSNEAALGDQAEIPATQKPKRARNLGRNISGNPTSSGEANTNHPLTANRPAAIKADIVVSKLRAAKGATIEALMAATGWQAHSVRGFLSGTVRKKLGLPLESEVGKDGQRRYRLAK